jgi:hypothetical protein
MTKMEAKDKQTELQQHPTKIRVCIAATLAGKQMLNLR